MASRATRLNPGPLDGIVTMAPTQNPWTDPTVIAAVVTAAGAVILVILGWVSGGFAAVWREWLEARERKRALVGQWPKRTMIVHPMIDQAFGSYWSKGMHGPDESARVSGFFAVTGTTAGTSAQAIQVEVRPRGQDARAELRQAQFVNATGNNQSVHPGLTEMWQLSFHLVPPPPMRRDIVANVTIVDQFGNRHVIKRHRFRSR